MHRPDTAQLPIPATARQPTPAMVLRIPGMAQTPTVPARTQPLPTAARRITRRSAAHTEHRRPINPPPPVAKPDTALPADISPAAHTAKQRVPARATVPADMPAPARRTPATVLQHHQAKAVLPGARPAR